MTLVELRPTTIDEVEPETAAALGWEPLMTSHDLCAYAGITYRQCDYWTRVGILHPCTQATPGSGYARRYAPHEADVALTMRRLLDASIDPRLASQLARQILAGETARLGVFALVPIPGDLTPEAAVTTTQENPAHA